MLPYVLPDPVLQKKLEEARKTHVASVRTLFSERFEKDELEFALFALSGPLKPHDSPVNGSSMPRCQVLHDVLRQHLDALATVPPELERLWRLDSDDASRWRGLPADPMRAYAESGYQTEINSDRVGGQQAGWGA